MSIFEPADSQSGRVRRSRDVKSDRLYYPPSVNGTHHHTSATRPDVDELDATVLPSFRAGGLEQLFLAESDGFDP
jgi:hypothetical protein